jgi:hypothetical protein
MAIKLIESVASKIDSTKLNWVVEVSDRIGSWEVHEKGVHYKILVFRKGHYDFDDGLIGSYKTFDHVGKVLDYINQVIAKKYKA